MEDAVIQLPLGRSIRYAATCNAFGGNDKLPLSMVDTDGNTALIAYIRPLRHGGFFVEPVMDIPPPYYWAKIKTAYTMVCRIFFMILGSRGFWVV